MRKTTNDQRGVNATPEHMGVALTSVLSEIEHGSQRLIMKSSDLLDHGDAVDDDDGKDAPEIRAAVPEAFHIDDNVKASWAVRKIVEARARAARVREWAARELRRCERDEQWLLRRFGAELEGWLRAEIGRRGGRLRSVSLPDGTIGLRKLPAKLEVLDEVALVAWCERQLPQAIRVCVEAEGACAVELARWQRGHEEDARVKRHVLREPLARHLSESGELADGADLTPAQDRFYVK